MSLNDPELVRREYSDETRLATRRALWESSDGPDPWQVAFEAVAERKPNRILEVGPGPGEFSARLGRDFGVDVVAVDLSPRMVELARARGVDARLGDIQALPYADASFDCAVAAWVLYHVPDLERGLGELARVLGPSGRLVAVTNSARNLWELWSLFGADAERRHPFSCENGAALLEGHFARVERLDVRGRVWISDREEARRYVAASVTRSHLADELPEDVWPLQATSSVCILVADKESA
ncbi:MAG TPA: class I SAM-dependent methyltransferase [Gaiellaceae bacterium]